MKSKAGEDGSYVPHSSGWRWRQRKKEDQKWIGHDLDLIWIEIGVFKTKKNSRNELARPVMGTIFLV